MLASCAKFSSTTRSPSSTDRYCSRLIPMANPAQVPSSQPAPMSPPAPAGINFKAVLQELIRRNGSDLHLKVGRPPTIRVDGELQPLDQTPLKPEDLKALAE